MVLIMLVVLATSAFAATGWFNDYIVVNGTWFWIGSDPGANTQFEGHDFGEISSLNISECQMKYWSDTQDRTGGAFYWRIGTEGGGNEVIWAQSYISGNDYVGEANSLNIDVLDGLANGAYTLQIWAKSWGTMQGDSYLSAGGANYSATFTKADPPAPITLASFTAKAKKGVVEVAWVTESQTENAKFLVYRDGLKIAEVEGAGTTSETMEYLVVDETVLPGVHEYALADVSLAGDVVEHEAVTVEVGTALAEANFVLNKAYPNPFNPRVTLSMEFAEGTNSEISIYNTQGALVQTLYNGYLEAGSHELNWNASNMQSGVYIVKMVAGNVSSTQKLVLMK